MEMKPTTHTVEPVCDACKTTVSERGRYYFCPNCIRDYCTVIYPDEPEHPMYEEIIRWQPEVLEGGQLIDSENYEDFGRIEGVVSHRDEVELSTPGAESRVIKYENLSDIVDEIRSGEIFVV